MNTLLKSLIRESLVIESLPPRVLKTQTKFAVSCRFLLGGKLNLAMDSPEVVVSLINEGQARDMMAEDAKESKAGPCRISVEFRLSTYRSCGPCHHLEQLPSELW